MRMSSNDTSFIYFYVLMLFADFGLNRKCVANVSVSTNYSHFAKSQVGVLNGVLQNEDASYHDPPPPMQNTNTRV
jgi:hypothetical protein